MSLQASWKRYTLNFTFDAGTSRGVMRSRDTWILKVWREEEPYTYGLGEAGPLPGLSIDHRPDIESHLERLTRLMGQLAYPADEADALQVAASIVPDEWPSLRFAVETALLDLLHGGRRSILPGAFEAMPRVPINGLIWMGDKPFMLQQMEDKLAAGFTCLKMKIGAIDGAEEEDVLDAIRERLPASELILRVDANGAFSPDEAPERLKSLARYDLHSIEQPIKPGQRAILADLCQSSPVPVALDEELIGIHSKQERAELLDEVKPFGIVLKPSLVGGIAATREWIGLAEDRGITWWITSALESNIGLNAIAQLTASYKPVMHQGLGTGQLYDNNFPSPLVIRQGSLQYDKAVTWDLSQLDE
ncbi:o-succinylbenzoate synthase [Roseivirga sp. BDSF3-8]|uniref:o-succinylbenzoate synthase n=1 Tax=Roseivirga sp. BDSF3-8 TaxID=3241598 RepID=UPI0035321038